MDIKDLIRSIDIVEYISQFVDLEQKGDEWWGLSPFKDEKTPSFSIRKDPPFFYDYSSGKGGNLYTFIKEYYNCTPIQVVDIMKKYAGYECEVGGLSSMLDAVKVAKRYSNTHEKTHKQSTATVLPDDCMNRYEKKEDKLVVWENEGISRESLDKYQVYYDAFSDRLVYPIRDMDNRIVNIGGRALSPTWKEDGQRKYCYFYSWGTINTIYGVPENMDKIKEKHEVVIFEGCKSVLLADTWGIDNCGAILTSHLSDNQMKILAKLGCDVVFALDKDVNIRADKNIQRLKRYVNVYYLYDFEDLLDAKDSPVDKGKDVFMKLYDQKFKLK